MTGEAKQLGFAMYNIAFTGIIIVTILRVAHVDQVGKIILQAIGVLWGSLFSAFAFVLPRLIEVQRATLKKTTRTSVESFLQRTQDWESKLQQRVAAMRSGELQASDGFAKETSPPAQFYSNGKTESSTTENDAKEPSLKRFMTTESIPTRKPVIVSGHHRASTTSVPPPSTAAKVPALIPRADRRLRFSQERPASWTEQSKSKLLLPYDGD